jgi:hypothetical protein
MKSNTKRIIFITTLHGIKQSITIESDKLKKWSNKSDYIHILLNINEVTENEENKNNEENEENKNNEENEDMELNLCEIVDIYTLLNIFNYFETGTIHNQPNSKSMLLNGLAYFGIDSIVLNSIKKGLGMIWKLSDIDSELNRDELTLLNNVNSLIYQYNCIFEKESKDVNEKESKDVNEKESISQQLKFIDDILILNTDTYNLLYERLYENVPNIVNKIYEMLNNTNQKIHPEFDLSFIKQEFNKHSYNIFDGIEDCVVTGGMVSKHFTYNSYFIDTDYDVFITTRDSKRALEIIKTLYNRLSAKMKTYIIKTKNTITLYNTKFEIQIITKLHNSIAEVLTHFDLDSCCVGYCNGNLYALPRFIRSLAYSGNIFDPDRQSPSYIHRLKKYMKRGFTIYIPGLRKTDTSYNKDNYLIQKLREKTDRFEKDSDYCDFFVYMKNRNNKEIKEVLEQFHDNNKYMDTYQINDIEDILKPDFKVNWNLKRRESNIDYYQDMYHCEYIL